MVFASFWVGYIAANRLWNFCFRARVPRALKVIPQQRYFWIFIVYFSERKLRSCATYEIKFKHQSEVKSSQIEVFLLFAIFSSLLFSLKVDLHKFLIIVRLLINTQKAFSCWLTLWSFLRRTWGKTFWQSIGMITRKERERAYQNASFLLEFCREPIFRNLLYCFLL